MIGRLLALFILVPLVDLSILIALGQRVGLLATVGLILGTGAAGATLVRHQGLGVLRAVEQELAEHRLPVAAALDGVMILVAGVLLITPGLLTDLAGFCLLVPSLRAGLRRGVARWIERQIARGSVHVAVGGVGWSTGEGAAGWDEGDIIDVSATQGDDAGSRPLDWRP